MMQLLKRQEVALNVPYSNLMQFAASYHIVRGVLLGFLLCLLSVELVAEAWVMDSIAMPAHCDSVSHSGPVEDHPADRTCSLAEDTDDPGDLAQQGWSGSLLIARASSRLQSVHQSCIPVELLRPPARAH